MLTKPPTQSWLRPVKGRGLALLIGLLCIGTPVLAQAAGPSPQASQRIEAVAQLRFPTTHRNYVLMDLNVAGPTTGYPASPGFVDVGLRSCSGSDCDAPATYRVPLAANQFSAATNASSASLSATIMGVPIKLDWASSSDYQAHPTLVVNRGAVTAAAGGYLIVPADRDADAQGLVNKRSCHAVQATITYQAVAGTPEDDAVTRAPKQLPARFRNIQRRACG
ncbi:MAG: hypothetical protein M3O32_01940 [Actinomycetota bacterium]|nr:hypothetical protein [Actinomycetota bacterium]